MGALRILLVEDDGLMRNTLATSLSINQTIEVQTAPNVSQALKLALECFPDCLVTDLHLGDGPNGIDLARALRKKDPTLGVVFLTSFEDPRLSGSQENLPENCTYLVKQTLLGAEEIVEAILNSSKCAFGGGRAAKKPLVSKFTQTQLETMRLIALGHSNAQISKIRFVSEKAVEKSVRALLEKLDLSEKSGSNSRAQITKKYFEMTGGKS